MKMLDDHLDEGFLKTSLGNVKNLQGQKVTSQQRLKIAQQNLSGLISARETFQLEMAQNNIPWRIISRPHMNSIPIKPNYRNNLFLGIIIGFDKLLYFW